MVGCLTSQQQASVSQGWICSDNFTCCHTVKEVADQTFYLTQSQYTDTRPTSPSADPITPGAWQVLSHWYDSTPPKNPSASRIRTRDLPLSRWMPYYYANKAVWEEQPTSSKANIILTADIWPTTFLHVKSRETVPNNFTSVSKTAHLLQVQTCFCSCPYGGSFHSGTLTSLFSTPQNRGTTISVSSSSDSESTTITTY